MSVQIEIDALTDAAGAERALAARDLYTMQIDVPPVQNAPHWHSFDAEFYVLSGHVSLTDAESGVVHECPEGTRVVVPEGTLHAEASVDGYTVLLGTSVPPEQFGDPVDRPPETL